MTANSAPDRPTVTCGIAVSVDGFVAGPNQSVDDPLGQGGELLHRWMFEQPDDHRAELEHLSAAGAFIMGRNMFGPGRGAWDESWRGWWGEEGPFAGPVFVLTHHPRAPFTLRDGPTITFVTDGPEAALARARAAAGGGRVAIAGGAATVNQYLAAGLVDELWLHVAPVTLGGGARLFDGVPPITLEPVEARHTDLVTHVRYRVLSAPGGDPDRGTGGTGRATTRPAAAAAR